MILSSLIIAIKLYLSSRGGADKKSNMKMLLFFYMHYFGREFYPVVTK
jgi:hypothetical protein